MNVSLDKSPALIMAFIAETFKKGKAIMSYDPNYKPQSKLGRQTVELAQAIAASIAAGRTIVERNKQADERAHAQMIARQDAQRKEKK